MAWTFIAAFPSTPLRTDASVGGQRCSLPSLALPGCPPPPRPSRTGGSMNTPHLPSARADAVPSVRNAVSLVLFFSSIPSSWEMHTLLSHICSSSSGQSSRGLFFQEGFRDAARTRLGLCLCHPLSRTVSSSYNCLVAGSIQKATSLKQGLRSTHLSTCICRSCVRHQPQTSYRQDQLSLYTSRG